MNRNIYTCGHVGEAVPATVNVKTITREGKHAIDTMTICDNCLIWYRKNNLIIDTNEQRLRWLGITSVKGADGETNEC